MDFYDSQGRVKEELFNAEAENQIEEFVSDKAVNSKGTSKKLTMTQLRRFYNDVKLLQSKWEMFTQNLECETKEELETKKKEEFYKYLPHIRLWRAKACYAKGKVPENFIKWLSNMATSIETYKDFEVFVLYFEAMVAFSKVVGMKES